jgi:predicted  nucleic acid-binding Zn-ribbon protein
MSEISDSIQNLIDAASGDWDSETGSIVETIRRNIHFLIEEKDDKIDKLESENTRIQDELDDVKLDLKCAKEELVDVKAQRDNYEDANLQLQHRLDNGE